MRSRNERQHWHRSIVATLSLSGLIMVSGIASAQTNNNDTSSSTTQSSSSNKDSSGSGIKLGKVIKTVTPEKAVATVSKTKVEHTSPSENLLSILKNVPGFNVLSSGPGNLLSSDTAFTLNGFNSSEVGTTFDGVPIINTFRGSATGQGDDHALTPLTTGQISSVQVYSGANTAQQNSIDSLGGTINFSPKLPSDIAGAEVSFNGGEYSKHGDIYGGYIEANSGAIKSLGGLKVLARIEDTHAKGFQLYTHAHITSYYLAAVQPFNQGMSQLSLIVAHNDEKARMPEMIPLAIIDQNGRNYQYPADVATNWVKTHSTHVILGLDSLLNPITVVNLKLFANITRNDRTAYANPIYNNNYLGYGLPTHLKSGSALDGYGNLFNSYNSTVATATYGSPQAGSQYQRYVDDYRNLGAKGHLSIMLPYNTLTIGSMVMQSNDLSEEGWYGSQPTPIVIGYNDAWVEHDSRNYWDKYIQDNISLANGKLHIYPSVKHVTVAITSNDAQGYYYNYGGSNGKTYSFTEPSLGASFSPIKPLNVYVNAGRTYKAPNISAFYSSIGQYGHPTPLPISVKPEYVDSIDAGIRYSSQLGKISLSVFNRRFTDIFSYSYSNVTGITTEYNAGTATYKGFTIAAEKPLFDNLAIEGNYGYTDAKYTKSFTGDNGTVTAGMPRPNVPRYTANLAIVYKQGGWFANLSDHFVGSQYLPDNHGVTTTTKLPAYSTANLNVSYTWHLNAVIKKLKLAAYIDNLFNQKYIANGYIQTGTTPYELVQEGAPRFAGLTMTGSF